MNLVAFLRKGGAHARSREPAHGSRFRALAPVEMRDGRLSFRLEPCDQLSTFMARMISHNRTDARSHSNFFSSALNELLEVSFRSGSPDGRIGCGVYRWGPTERVELRSRARPGRAFYREAVRRPADGDAHARYLDSISTDLAPSREAVLLDCRSIRCRRPARRKRSAIDHACRGICLLKEW